ncbi:MAG: (Fe-S)-binding protein, partial [Deltaproteobacteria bacterium]
MAPPLNHDLFPGVEPENICLLFQLGLAFLVTGGKRPEHQQRLAWLEKHQDLDDLRDLLLLFLAAVQEQDPVPPPSEVLDLLQRQGYPVQHQDFSDEYRAFLVPLEDLSNVLKITLSWPLDPATLSGDPQKDLNLAGDQEERRRLRLQAFKEAALAYCQGRENPLPYAEFIRPAARFVAVWLAAHQHKGEQSLDRAAQVQEAVSLLPSALLKLIRPRKGYELTHRSQLERLLREEFQAYQQAISRCRHLGCIANEDDDARFFQMAAALALAPEPNDLEALLPEEVMGLEMAEVLGSLKELAAAFSLDLEPGAAPHWYEFKDWLREKVEWSSLVDEENYPGKLPANWNSVADTLLQELASQLYRLVVARARAERGLAHLSGDQVLLTWLAAWLTPEKQALQKAASSQLLKSIQEQARRAVWESYPLVVESREELVALIKYYLALELQGRDLESYSRTRRVGALPEKVAARLLKRCHIPPEIAGPGGPAAVIQEVLRPRAPEAVEAQRQLEEEVLALLPRTDCGSCGSRGCLAFARLLLLGRAQPTQCLTSPAATKVRLA